MTLETGWIMDGVKNKWHILTATTHTPESRQCDVLQWVFQALGQSNKHYRHWKVLITKQDLYSPRQPCQSHFFQANMWSHWKATLLNVYKLATDTRNHFTQTVLLTTGCPLWNVKRFSGLGRLFTDYQAHDSDYSTWLWRMEVSVIVWQQCTIAESGSMKSGPVDTSVVFPVPVSRVKWYGFGCWGLSLTAASVAVAINLNDISVPRSQ